MFSRALSSALLVLLVGCGADSGRPDAGRATPCETSAPVSDTSGLPANLPFDEWGTVTYVNRKKGFEVVRFVSETTVVELHPKIARALLDSGYEIVGADNEGFESEIFFKPGGKTTGFFQLREGPCEGLVTTSMIFEQGA